MRTKQEEKKVREEGKNILRFKSSDGPGEGGAQHPVFRINGPKKTGAASALAQRGQNPLLYVYKISVHVKKVSDLSLAPRPRCH
jgi:hypothetical protein